MTKDEFVKRLMADQRKRKARTDVEIREITLNRIDRCYKRGRTGKRVGTS